MITLQSKAVHESSTHPGVSFTVRSLNRIQRAKRDLPIIDARVRRSALAAEYAPLGALVRYKGEGDDKKVDKDGRSPEQISRCSAIDAEFTWLDDSTIKPANIRAGLISIEGLEIDGTPATAESLIASAGADYDDLIDEINDACEAAAGLTDAKRKNSQSGTTSSAQAVPESTASSATSAAG